MSDIPSRRPKTLPQRGEVQYSLRPELRLFANRVRLNRHDFDHERLAGSQNYFAPYMEAMEGLVLRTRGGRKLTLERIEKLILQSLNVAADEQLRHNRSLQTKKIYCSQVESLDALIQILAVVCDALNQATLTDKAYLNRKFSSTFDYKAFDTEIFAELVRGLVSWLPGLRRRGIAPAVLSALYGGDPTIDKNRGMESGETILALDYWETMPSITRVAVEQWVRLKKPRGLISWLDALAVQLKANSPTVRRGRPTNSIRPLAMKIARHWRNAGITPGLVWNEHTEGNSKSIFQQFCETALRAVGDNSQVSRHQVAAIRRLHRNTP